MSDASSPQDLLTKLKQCVAVWKLCARWKASSESRDPAHTHQYRRCCRGTNLPDQRRATLLPRSRLVAWLLGFRLVHVVGSATYLQAERSLEGQGVGRGAGCSAGTLHRPDAGFQVYHLTEDQLGINASKAIGCFEQELVQRRGQCAGSTVSRSRVPR